MRKSNKGFTLIELMIVMIIVSIIVSVALDYMDQVKEPTEAEVMFNFSRHYPTAIDTKVQCSAHPRYYCVATGKVPAMYDVNGEVTHMRPVRIDLECNFDCHYSVVE